MTEEDLLALVVVCPSGCWIWAGADSGTGRGGGYGKMRDPETGQTVYVHVYVYRKFRGVVPRRKQVDHLCRQWYCGDNPRVVRRCVNPHHLDLVTQRQNLRRIPR